MYSLYNEDFIDCLERLISEGVVVDHVITDMPYYNVVKDEWDNYWKSEEDYLKWCEEIIKRLSIIVKEGNIILFTSRQYNRKINYILDKYFNEKRVIIWARKRMCNNTRGKSISSGYEPISYYSRGNAAFNMIKIKPESNRKEYREGILKDGVNISDVWIDIPALVHNSKEKVNHPTQKPVRLMERCVEMFSNEGDTIMDFTMGSGTTGVACLNLNRNFIGIELDKEYFNIAKYRISTTSEMKNK